MKVFIACLLFGLLLTIIAFLSFAQQNQSTQKLNPEIETIKKRILELENKLQTVENVDKMELAAKLADANTKLANAEFGKFERELRDSNDEWVRAWGLGFLTILGIFVAILLGVSYVFWYWLRSRADQLIADSVEKSLNGFKDAVNEVNVLKDQLRVLEKEHASAVLENLMDSYLLEENSHPEQIKALREEILLEVFGDEICLLEVRCKAVEVLAARKSSRLVAPVLKFLNSVVNSDLHQESAFDPIHYLNRLLNFVGKIYTNEAYEGFNKFLNRLLTEDLKHKDLFLTQTVFSLADIGVKLGIGDSVSILRRAIPDLNVPLLEYGTLSKLAEYFDRFRDPDGIKEILKNNSEDEVVGFYSFQESIEDKCLELLQKHDPEFVEEWQAQKATDNAKNKEPS